jgi:peptide/nickel transport system substrate-binding protein
MARWEKGKRLILQANKEWWAGPPYIETVEVLFGLSDDEIIDGLRKNKLDYVEIRDVATWSRDVQLPEFREDFEASQVVEASFQLIAWNVQRKIFDDKRVRVALTHALDRERIIADVLFGEARPLSAPFFPNMYGADMKIAPYEFDLDKATKLLDEAGYPRGDKPRFEINLIVSESSRGNTVNEMLAIFRRNLGSIGVDLKVEFMPSPTFTDRMVMREFDAAYLGWLPDIPDPDPYALLHSSVIPHGSVHAGYANPEVDRLLDEARATTDRDERNKIYHQVHRILHDDVPYTLLYSDFAHYAWSKRLNGVNPRDIGPQPRFPGLARWWISSEPTK